MGAMKAKFEAEYEAAKEHLLAALAHLKEIGHDAVAHVEGALHALEGDAPKLEAEAAGDAADVVHTAETQGVVPAEREAAKDGAALIADAGHDVAAAVEGSAKPAPQPATDPKNVTALVAGGAAAASEPTA